jgi:hypothetical protein
MRLASVSTALLISATAFAQPPNTAPEQIEAIKACSFMSGRWAGNGWMAFGPGQRRPFHETENVRPKLEGLLFEIEGVGTNDAGKIVHAALAILSFDPDSKQYHFRAYDGTGNYLDTIAGCKDGIMSWSMPAGPRQMRYTIKLNQKGQWYETGEMSMNGQAGQQFFEMTLDKAQEKQSQ